MSEEIPAPAPLLGTVYAGSDGPHYPQVETHTWGEFPIAVVEMGGYGDVTMVDPHSGKKLLLCQALGTVDNPRTVYEALRDLIDSAERWQFLG